MPISAMPEHLNSKEKIEAAFPDDSQYGDSLFGRLYKRYQKVTKTWFAFSYRCTEWWAKWRKYPIVLFGVKGAGPWRFEHEGGYFVEENVKFIRLTKLAYLSRIQYYTRWHFAIQWPLMISFHFYLRAEDVPIYGRPRPESDDGLWFGYWNHYDADNVYWMLTSAYLGKRWK